MWRSLGGLLVYPAPETNKNLLEIAERKNREEKKGPLREIGRSGPEDCLAASRVKSLCENFSG